jgi:hypothetical protein
VITVGVVPALIRRILGVGSELPIPLQEFFAISQETGAAARTRARGDVAPFEPLTEPPASIVLVGSAGDGDTYEEVVRSCEVALAGGTAGGHAADTAAGPSSGIVSPPMPGADVLSVTG